MTSLDFAPRAIFAPRGSTSQTRLADLQPGSYDDKARTVEAVLSVGAAVGRPYGTEVLEITSKAVDLKRVPLPLLDSHNLYGVTNILGRVDRVWFEPGKLVGKISFDDSEVGRKAEGLVARRMVRGVSIRYRVDKWEIKDGDGNVVDPERERLLWDAQYTFKAKRWELQEASLVTVPADPDAEIRTAQALIARADGFISGSRRGRIADVREVKRIRQVMRVRQAMFNRHQVFIGWT
jgi:hypothetical protein